MALIVTDPPFPLPTKRWLFFYILTRHPDFEYDKPKTNKLANAAVHTETLHAYLDDFKQTMNPIDERNKPE